jgi:hypothetical protein
MISPQDIQVTKTDLTLVGSVVVVSNLVNNMLQNTPLFDQQWMNSSMALLMGVIIHGLFTNKISSMVNQNVDNEGLRNSIYDLVKFGTFFTAQHAITSLLEGKPIVFDQKWVMSSSLVIGGYSLFNMFVKDMVPKVDEQFQPLLNDIVKVSMGSLLSNLVMDGTITQTHLMGLGASLAGFAVFHLVTKKLI